MLKDKLFKFLFPKKYERLEYVTLQRSDLSAEVMKLSSEVNKLRLRVRVDDSISESEFMQYCLQTLNIPWLNFANVDDDGKPPHYLAGLTTEARKDFVAHMESMYADEKFQTVVSYVINLIGNHSIQKAEDDKMRNGKIGIVGIRTLMSEFINAHKEYVDSRKSGDDFDKLAILPE